MTGNHKIPNLCGQLHNFDATSCKDDQVYKPTYMSMVRGMRETSIYLDLLICILIRCWMCKVKHKGEGITELRACARQSWELPDFA
jgi:hypothetical protein